MDECEGCKGLREECDSLREQLDTWRLEFKEELAALRLEFARREKLAGLRHELAQQEEMAALQQQVAELEFTGKATVYAKLHTAHKTVAICYADLARLCPAGPDPDPDPDPLN